MDGVGLRAIVRGHRAGRERRSTSLGVFRVVAGWALAERVIETTSVSSPVFFPGRD